MAGFVGMNVAVTLKEPPNTVLLGTVIDVIAGQTLTLQNVYVPSTGARFERQTVPGQVIADLEVVATNSSAPATSASESHATATAQSIQVAESQYTAKQAPAPGQLGSHQSHRPQPTPSSTTQGTHGSAFADPAILSYSKPQNQAKLPAEHVDTPPAPKTSTAADVEENPPEPASPFVGEVKKDAGSRRNETNRKARLRWLKDENAAEGQKGEAFKAQEIDQADNGSKRRVRRGQKKKAAAGAPQDPPSIMNIDVSRNGNDMNANVKRGKGWRQTPLLQPSPQEASPNERIGTARPQRQREREQESAQNGWATEDATDIQDLGEFDFEANHKLFDKKQVFDELRLGDTTADEDRLVSHNKLQHRPGTYGGKNLHPTENVLSPTLGPNANSNDLDSSSEADTELNFLNGRSSSRHSSSRNPMKRLPSRQNSLHVEGKAHPSVASQGADRGTGLNRSLTSLPGRPSRAISAMTGTSSNPDRTNSPHSLISTSTRTQPPATVSPSSQYREPHLVTYPNMVHCPVLLPQALETLEQETVSRYGLTQEAITESAARCIAETAMGMFDHASPYESNSRRSSRANTVRAAGSAAGGNNMISSATPDNDSNPVAVIIAGNHPSGARAIAAARHLLPRRTRVIVVEALYESPDYQDTQCKLQLAMLKRLIKQGGASIKRGNWRKASNHIKSLSGPPAVIIDALLAGSTCDSLPPSHTAAGTTSQDPRLEAREIISWANRSRAPVLSISCPSGVSGLDGSAPLFEGEPLAVRPEEVVCLGAPLRGVLESMKAGEKWDRTWLGDVGVNIALRSEERVGFGRVWCVELRYVDQRGEERLDI